MGVDSDFVAAIAGVAAGLALIVLIWVVLVIVAYWKIFTKAGEPGWKALIPYYNSYVMYSLTWETLYFWITLAITFAGTILNRADVSWLAGILSVASMVIGLIQLHKLSKAFGHGAGFTLGLIFLNPIFLMILAFGSSEYMGPQ